jgi:hypothetical protein
VNYELKIILKKVGVNQSRYYEYNGICLEGLRETTKYLNQDSQCAGKDSNHRLSEWNSGSLPVLLGRNF